MVVEQKREPNRAWYRPAQVTYTREQREIPKSRALLPPPCKSPYRRPESAPPRPTFPFLPPPSPPWAIPLDVAPRRARSKSALADAGGWPEPEQPRRPEIRRRRRVPSPDPWGPARGGAGRPLSSGKPATTVLYCTGIAFLSHIAQRLGILKYYGGWAQFT